MECRRKEVWPHYWDTNYSLIRRHKIAISPVRRPAIDVRLVVGQARTCATSIMGRVYGGVTAKCNGYHISIKYSHVRTLTNNSYM